MVDSDLPERPAKIGQSEDGTLESQSESADDIPDFSKLEINDNEVNTESESWVVNYFLLFFLEIKILFDFLNFEEIYSDLFEQIIFHTWNLGQNGSYENR